MTPIAAFGLIGAIYHCGFTCSDSIRTRKVNFTYCARYFEKIINEMLLWEQNVSVHLTNSRSLQGHTFCYGQGNVQHSTERITVTKKYEMRTCIGTVADVRAVMRGQ